MKIDHSYQPESHPVPSLNNASPLWNAFSRVKSPVYPKLRKTFVRGEGAYLWDSDGRKYFDGFSSLWTNLIGHGRKEISEALQKQSEQLSFMHLFSGTQHPAAIEISERLTSLSPFGHQHCFLGLSGSDATETAMKMARAFWSAQGRPEKNIILGRMSEYHGTSFGALSLMGWDSYQKPYAPLLPRTHRIAPPNCYRCPWDLDPARCGSICKNSFHEYFEQVDARKNVAAILIEPVITSDGLITPPAGYWQDVQQACKAHDVLIICDEVSTGMGRTGRLYAATHYELSPDITYLAKSLTSGYAPLSATLASPRVHEGIHSGDGFFSHGTTFGGHPLGCVAALKTLEILERERLIENVSRLEERLRKGLMQFCADLPIVGNIRGKGLLFEVELVANRATREPPVDEIALAAHVYSEALEQGQYLRPLGRFICIAPPLIAKEAEIDELCLGLQRALKKIMEQEALWGC